MNQVQVIEKQGQRNSQWSRGYGKDTGGGDTVGLLRYVDRVVITSLLVTVVSHRIVCMNLSTLVLLF